PDPEVARRLGHAHPTRRVGDQVEQAQPAIKGLSRLRPASGRHADSVRTAVRSAHGPLHWQATLRSTGVSRGPFYRVRSEEGALACERTGRRGARYPFRVSLRLHDTATRSVRDFVPRVPGEVGIYLCGLTVQSPPHIGHLRSAVNYDVLRRWLMRSGFRVTFIRNITDIDDKILAKSVEHKVPFWSVAYANERILARQYARLGVLEPTYEPRATGHVPEMHELIEKLIARGHAYPATDGSGDVYFDVTSFPRYGELSGQKLDSMQPSDDGPARAKRDPRDFALWKGAKAEEPPEAQWPSPWGRGRPGWHIECSAMCWRYLGAEFDIHGGGLDLVFPHHENEVAQSQSAGLPFARYWVHHGLLNLGGAKMGKSTGNVIDLPSIEALGVRPVELRYYITAAHYRSMIDY